MNPFRDEPSPKDAATVKRWGVMGLVVVVIKSSLKRKRVTVNHTVKRETPPGFTSVGYLRSHENVQRLCDSQGERE